MHLHNPNHDLVAAKLASGDLYTMDESDIRDRYYVFGQCGKDVTVSHTVHGQRFTIALDTPLCAQCDHPVDATGFCVFCAVKS